MKTTYDISLYYQILPHSHMILSASRIRIIGLGRIEYGILEVDESFSFYLLLLGALIHSMFHPYLLFSFPGCYQQRKGGEVRTVVPYEPVKR